MPNPIVNFFLGSDEEGEDFTPTSSHPTKQQLEDKLDEECDGDIVFFKPLNIDSTKKFVDYLKAGRSIVLNVAQLSDEAKTDTLTFIQGALLVLEGQMFEVGMDIYLCTPEGIEVGRQLGRY